MSNPTFPAPSRERRACRGPKTAKRGAPEGAVFASRMSSLVEGYEGGFLQGTKVDKKAQKIWRFRVDFMLCKTALHFP